MKINIANITDVEIVVFDLGGVVMDVVFDKTLDAFARLDIGRVDKGDIIAGKDSFFRELEVGEITGPEFIDKFRLAYPASKNIPEEAIWEAWHALLQPYESERIELLKKIAGNYKIYLFSNTNAPHREVFRRMFREQFGSELDSLFEKCYYSDVLHLRKPDPAAYEAITKDLGVEPGKILFIDDTAANVEQARACGWQAYRLTGGETIGDIFGI